MSFTLRTVLRSIAAVIGAAGLTLVPLHAEAQSSPPPGEIVTVAGTMGSPGYSGDGGQASEAQFNDPVCVTRASDGSLYICDLANYRVRRIGPDGVITTFAGNGTRGDSGDGGPATEAQLDWPEDIAVGPDGAIYISEFNLHKVRRIGPDGVITTFAGNGTEGDSGDGGPATDAQLNFPVGLTFVDGSLYIADEENNKVRRVGPDGVITTFAGNGTEGDSGDGGPANQAQLSNPVDVEPGDGSLYISDIGNNKVRRVGPDGTITTFAGNGTEGGSGDGGPATDAQLSGPNGLAFLEGSLYIADRDNNKVRRVGPDGIITTFAGNGTRGGSGDGGPAVEAELNYPADVAAGSLYIADSQNHVIRQVGTAPPQQPPPPPPPPPTPPDDGSVGQPATPVRGKPKFTG